jgi:diadenosine tetraphosphate (Ap4A) HIT family hydrolase
LRGESDVLVPPRAGMTKRLPVGDQSVFHFHMHVVPRHADDGIALSWPRKEPAADVLLGYAQRLRAAMSET